MAWPFTSRRLLSGNSTANRIKTVSCKGLDETRQKKVKKLFARVWLMMFLELLQGGSVCNTPVQSSDFCLVEVRLRVGCRRGLQMSQQKRSRTGFNTLFHLRPEKGLQELEWESHGPSS